MTLQHEFVKFIPEKLAQGILYISTKYRIAAHLCPCKCGEEVMTPITPADWTLIFDGDSISLYPSIGNWNFKCQSHYWIRNSQVIIAEKWSKRRIKQGQAKDQSDALYYFDSTNKNTPVVINGTKKANSTKPKH